MSTLYNTHRSVQTYGWWMIFLLVSVRVLPLLVTLSNLHRESPVIVLTSLAIKECRPRCPRLHGFLQHSPPTSPCPPTALCPAIRHSGTSRMSMSSSPPCQVVWRLQRSSALRRSTDKLSCCWRRTTSWEPWTSNWAQPWKSLLRSTCSKTRSSSHAQTSITDQTHQLAQDLWIFLMTSKTQYFLLTFYTFSQLQGQMLCVGYFSEST